MKQKLLICLAVFGAMAIRSQTVTPVLLSNQGGYSQFSSGSISWSIGEPVSESYTSGGRIHTMGFHQPELNIVSIIQEQGHDVTVLVFPNPVKETLTVNFSGMNPGDYKLEMFDNIGKLILKSDASVTGNSQSVQLKINEVAAGNYFLRVDGKDFSKTIKINKIN
jgi:hypothetical protein